MMPTPSLYPLFLKASAGGSGVVVPAVIDVSVGVPVAAVVSQPTLTTQVNSPLAIILAESILSANIQAPISVDVETIQVEVDIC